jgi:hypothetical protein
MTWLLNYIERKPLGLSVVALVVSLEVLGLISLPALTHPPLELVFQWSSVVICCTAFAICVVAFVALARAERRGYSSTRIGLAVTALSFALVPQVLVAMKLFSLHWKPQ